MEALEDAKAEIDQARSGVSHSDVRTQLESITVSLQEMLDTAAGERTDADEGFAETDIAGTVPSDDNLLELEENLGKLAENTGREDVQDHLENARQKVAGYRTELQDDE